MTIHPSQALKYLSGSKAAAMGTDRVEVRLYAATIALLFFYQLGEPGTYVLFIEDSVMHKVARLSQFPTAVALGFYATALMLLPLMAVLAFAPDRLACKLPRKLACFAGIAGSFMWLSMAVLARPLDYEWAAYVFAIRAFVDLGLGVLFGLSLNAQHAREALERAEARKGTGDASTETG